MKNFMRYLTVFLFGLVSGGLLVYAAVSFKQRMIYYSEAKLVGLSEDIVRKAMAAFKEVTVQNDGFIKDTIYEDMVGHQGVESVADLQGAHRLVGFDYRTLPIRISTNFVENADFIVFSASGPQEILWLGFANGHVEKIQGTTVGGERLLAANKKHSELIQAAGYPSVWTDRGVRREWIKENGHKLIWDAKLKIFKKQQH